MIVARRKYIETLEAVGYTGITETVTTSRVEGDTIVCAVELTATRIVVIAAIAKQGKDTRPTTKAEREAALKAALEAANGKSK